MSFSTTYKAIRSQLRTDLATVFSLASTAIHNGVPETEETGNHVVLMVGQLASSYTHAVATGNRPGMDVNIECEAYLTYPASNTVLEDVALGYADSICALVEAGATYASVGMFPILSSFELGELTGILEGSGDTHLHLRFTLSFMVQRDRG